MTDLDAHRDRALEEVLRRHHLPADLFWVPLDNIDWDATNATQIRGGGTDPDVVDRYTAALDRAEPLPAGFGVRLDTRRVRVAGGIHRAAAYRAADRDRMPLYVLPADANPTAVLLVSIEHNARHGVPLTTEDRQRHALGLVDDHGLTQDAAAAIVGLSPAKISQAITTRDAGARATRLGLSAVWQSFGPSLKFLLGTAGKPWPDEVFEELLHTATAVNVDVVKARAMSAGLRDADSDDAALRFLSDYEAANHRAVGPRNEAGHLRKLCMEINTIDPKRFEAQTSDSFVDPTLDLIKRTARRLAACGMALEERQKAAAS